MASERPVSLRSLVPLLSAAFLAAVVALFGGIAYHAVRLSALETAKDRLTTVANVLAQPTAQTAAWIRQAQSLATDPGILEIVRSRGQRVTDSARALVARLTPDTGLTLATDVRGPDGDVLFSITSAAVDSASSLAAPAPDRPIAHAVGDGVPAALRVLADSVRLTRAYPDTAATSEFYVRGDQLLYERASPIREGGRVVGHLVQLRRVVAAPAVLRQVSSLIGKDAALVVGNADGSLWSDLVKPISHPPPSSVPQTYVRDGRRWIGATAHVTTGPWVIGVEFPEDIVLAPAHVLRSRFVAIGVLIVIIALLLAERLSRRLTGPLTRLTTAAERIAAGDRATPTFVLQRTDEIGRLSRAFSAMADSIRESHDTLEQQIGERTGELQTALTRLRDTQDELVRRERLATLGQLSSSIAHELRNPLAVMTNALYYLDSVLADAPTKVREHLGKVSAQVRLSESIITGLLDVTRTGSTRPDRVDVMAFIGEHLTRVSVPASIRVERDVPANLPSVWVDPVQIGQVLVNLFTNAIQAMESTGGSLTVRARAAGDRVRIDVADTGPGIPRDQQDKIFEPLFTTKARGIGLGLSVSRSLVDANRGELRVASSVGRGAMFTLELPIWEEHTSRADNRRGTATADSSVEVV